MSPDQHFYGLGRRKTAIARVLLVPQPDTRSVNNQELTAYFPTQAMQQLALQALQITSQAETFGLKAQVKGGGKIAQAQAVRLGTARALVKSDPLWRKQLKDAGLLTRDPRKKERKKPGLKRARRAPQFSKR